MTEPIVPIKCQRCQWVLYLDDRQCMLNPWSELYCKEYDFCYFQEKIEEVDCTFDSDTETCYLGRKEIYFRTVDGQMVKD